MATPHTFAVPDISCDHCVAAITDGVNLVPGVDTVDVSVDAKTVEVSGGDAALVAAAIVDAGYEIAEAASARPQAIAEVQIDNGIFRSTKWTFPPGSETGHHVHEYEYVVVPILAGELTIESHTEATFAAEISVGVSYTRAKGVAHNVVNNTDETIAFVEVELLDG